MVVEVVYHRDDPLLSLPGRDEEEEGRVLDSSMVSTYDMGRDTSHTNRDNYGDDTRQSFHTSILNCTGETEDEDEEVEEPGSFLFDDDDFHSPLNQSLEVPEEDVALVVASSTAPASPSPQKTLCCVNDKQWWLDTSLQNVTDSFVSLCSPQPDEACGFSDFVHATETCSRQLQHQVQFDLLQVLGCDDPTGGGGAGGDDVAWLSPLLIKASPTSTNNTAVRRNPRQRAERIRRLRNELLGAHHHVISPTRSVDDHARLDSWIGRGLDPIEQQEDGYDSDPGQVLQEPSCDSLRDTSLLDEEENEEEYHFYDGHRARVADEYNMRALYRGPKDEHGREIYDAVQEAMNFTWTLTWHAEGNPMPICIHFWIERGTMLNQGAIVVEPKFMWREVYQPSLATQRLLSESTCKPMDVRVLNACRIIEAGDDLDRTKYPMARSTCSFFLKTCRDEVFLFEATSPEEQAQIVHQWKLVVARLASLAVVEDMEAMAKEFFNPAVSSQMLITNDKSP